MIMIAADLVRLGVTALPPEPDCLRCSDSIPSPSPHHRNRRQEEGMAGPLLLHHRRALSAAGAGAPSRSRRRAARWPPPGPLGREQRRARRPLGWDYHYASNLVLPNS
jgi:hypothetical protein